MLTNQQDPTARFSDRVEYYVRSRPKYPAALLQFCREKLSLRADHVIADIGSGTGFLSELFVNNGNSVWAVEPNGPMRAAAEQAMRGLANFQSLDARAEATGLTEFSVDFIVCGQAFHWFDRTRSKIEFARILRPDGWVLLVWNERRYDSAFARDYEQLVQQFQSEIPHIAHRALTTADSTVLFDFFSPAGYSTTVFPNLQTLDLDGLLARAASSSYLPRPGQKGYDLMTDRLREIFSRHAAGGMVVQDYDTRLFYSRAG